MTAIHITAPDLGISNLEKNFQYSFLFTGENYVQNPFSLGWLVDLWFHLFFFPFFLLDKILYKTKTAVHLAF